MATFAKRVGTFNRQLHLDALLPAGVRVIDPYRAGSDALRLADAFYAKFFSDDLERELVLGINPGRFGGALSGVPFTDFKRLGQDCGIDTGGMTAHEPSSAFVYRMIAALGGVAAFYKRFFINSVCPLGFVIRNAAGRDLNYNYYDDPALLAAVEPFIVRSLEHMISLGCSRSRVICLGIRNAALLRGINSRSQLFETVEALPHPRYIMQYRHRFLDEEIERYRAVLMGAEE